VSISHWLVACLALATMTITTSSGAHQGGSTGYASIVVDRETIRYTLTLWLSAPPAPVADEVKGALAGDARNRDRLVSVLRDKITLRAEGQRCRPSPSSSAAPGPALEQLTLAVDFTCPEPVRHLLVRDDVFDVFGPDYHALARIDAPGHSGQFAFTPDSREMSIRVDAAGAGRNVSSFLLLGVEHILTGYDHLLFLAALLLGGGGLGSLLKIVTAFTVAHSLTLALAVLGIVTVPDRLVESVIAASIVYVALENVLWPGAVSRRWLVSFLFGLVHGFGFASALDPLALPRTSLAVALLGFNVGVETGQAAVVVVLLPALTWMQGQAWESGVVRTASLAVAVIGLAWLVQRVFFA
jgi:hypothetical protein